LQFTIAIMFGARRPLRSLQVEVTSRCSLSCAICPRTHVPGWRDLDLPDAAWTRLEEDLHLAADVHLQGWGEPLLDGRLPERVRRAHEAGCSVGLTTNGVALADAAPWIVAERVARVAVSTGASRSVCGAGGEGLAGDRIWDAVSTISSRRRGRVPRLLVSMILSRDSGEDLTTIVREAAEAGADEVYAIHIDCTPTRELLERAAFAQGALRPAIRDALAAAASAARRAGITFRTPACGPAAGEEDLLVCSLDPRRFAFVSSDGRIGPCINMLLPAPGPIVRCDEQGVHAIEPVVWGQLPQDSLAAALERQRPAFVKPFHARISADRLFSVTAVDGWGPPALRSLEEADRQRSVALADAPFPAACTACHKARGW
jgi:MoaA/NifB/PqqE/SkfB family radical SAM enzyme